MKAWLLISELSHHSYYKYYSTYSISIASGYSHCDYININNIPFLKKIWKKNLLCHLNSTWWASQPFYLIIFDWSVCVSPFCDPTDCSPPGSSVRGVLQAGVLERVAVPSSRGSSWPRDQTQLSCTVGSFFTIWGFWAIPCCCSQDPYYARFPREQTWPLQRSHTMLMTSVSIPVPSECELVILKPLPSWIIS